MTIGVLLALYFTNLKTNYDNNLLIIKSRQSFYEEIESNRKTLIEDINSMKTQLKSFREIVKIQSPKSTSDFRFNFNFNYLSDGAWKTSQVGNVLSLYNYDEVSTLVEIYSSQDLRKWIFENLYKTLVSLNSELNKESRSIESQFVTLIGASESLLDLYDHYLKEHQPPR